MLTLGPQVAAFFETYLRHPKGERFEEPFVLEPWQRDFVDEAYRVDEHGRRIYRQILLGIPRGNGKTPLAAGFGLFELMARRDAPDIFNIAGAKDQAKLLTDFAASFVDGTPEQPGKLAAWLTATKSSVTHNRTLGVMRLLSAAGSLQHGKSVSAALVDEIHALTSAEQREAYVAMWTAMHKRPDAFLLAITTAGFDRETLLGEMYAGGLALELEERLHVDGVGPCLRIGRDERMGVLFWWYGPPEQLPDGEPMTVDDAIANEAIWQAVNPASWVTVESLRKQLGGLGVDDYDFARLHLNMWTEARDVFLPAAWFKKNRSTVKPVRKRPVFAAVDVGLVHDTCAVGFSQPAVHEGKSGVVSRVRVWSANPEHERDRTARHVFVPDGRVDLEAVYEFLLGLHDGYGLSEIVADPTFFEGELQRLAKKGIKVAPLGQSGLNPMIAAQQYYIDVKQGTAWHPNDPVLNRHVAATAAVKTENGWRITKLRGGPNDATVAVSMSHWRASRQSGSVYEERGMRSVGGDDDGIDDYDD